MGLDVCWLELNQQFTSRIFPARLETAPMSSRALGHRGCLLVTVEHSVMFTNTAFRGGEGRDPGRSPITAQGREEWRWGRVKVRVTERDFDKVLGPREQEAGCTGSVPQPWPGAPAGPCLSRAEPCTANRGGAWELLQHPGL